MRIVLVDWTVDDDDALRCRFGEKLPETSDLLVWDCGRTADRWSSMTEGGPASRTLSPNDSREAVRQLREFRAEVSCALAAGALVVLLLPRNPVFNIHTPQELMPLSLLEALPGPSLRSCPIEAATAGQVEAVGTGEPFRSLFAPGPRIFRPVATVDSAVGMAVAVDSRLGAPVARYDYRHPGGVLLLPALDTESGAPGRRELLGRLKRLVLRLNVEDAPTMLCAWAHDTPHAELGTHIAEQDRLARELARLRLEHARASSARSRFERAWSIAAGEPALALAGFASVCAEAGWEPCRMTMVDDLLVLRDDGSVRVLIPVLEASDGSVDNVAERASALTSAVDDELCVAGAVPLYVYLADNPLPPHRRRGVPACLRNVCAAAGIGIVTGEELFEAWLAGKLDQLLRTGAAGSTPSAFTR